MLKPLRAGHRDLAWSFLTRHGIRDVFLASKVHEGGLARPDAVSGGRFHGAFQGQRLEGVLFLGHSGLTVFSTDLPHVRRLFAEEAWKERGRVRLLVGEWDGVSDFWSHLVATGLTSRRDWREVFCVVTSDRLSGDGEPALRAAAAGDLVDVAEASAQAYLEETGEDPRVTLGDAYVQRVARTLEEGRSFLLRVDGRLAYKADLSALCPVGAQIVGVYTAPEFRGQGIARRCTAELARRMLERVPVVCLFVKEANAPARRAYERAGFEPRLFFRTIFVDAAARNATARAPVAKAGEMPASPARVGAVPGGAPRGARPGPRARDKSAHR